MKCPKCGTDKGLYRNAEVKWSPYLEAWEVDFLDDEIDCTHCDHKWMLEE